MIASPLRGSIAYGVALSALIVLGVLRIVLTYPVFSQTADEPDHLGCGAHWLEGRYPPGCLEHPPLARLAPALSLGRARARAATPDSGATGDYGTLLLRSDGRYVWNLTLARASVLPFFVLACLVVWAWARRIYGDGAALAAVFLLQGLPPVLAHAGLATPDVALAAFLTLAFLLFAAWLEEPTLRNTVLLGVAAGLACLTKFSALLFLPTGAVMIFAFRAAAEGPAGPERQGPGRRWLGMLGLAALLTFGVIWAGYRFQSPALTDAADRPHRVGRMLGVERWPSGLRDALFRVVEAPVPAGHFVRGMLVVHRHNAAGHDAYFLGESGRTGWWLFFPALIALKTPLPFLALFLVGCWQLVRAKTNVPAWKRFAPLVAAAAVLVVSMPAQINIGVRHVLPVYLAFAMVAGLGLASLIGDAGRRVGWRVAGLFLGGWFVAVSIGAHPDYLAYFNRLAGGRPERIVVDSDLNWGQDVRRLTKAVTERGVSRLWYRCLTCRFLDDETLPPLPDVPSEMKSLEPYTPVSGWVAIDEWSLKVEGERLRPSGESRRAFDWLTRHPFERIGASIRLYRVPPAPGDSGAPPRD